MYLPFLEDAIPRGNARNRDFNKLAMAADAGGYAGVEGKWWVWKGKKRGGKNEKKEVEKMKKNDVNFSIGLNQP